MSIPLENFTKTLAAKRYELDLSQHDVAAKLGVGAQTLSNWECGRSFPPIKKLVEWADMFGYTICLRPKEGKE